MKRENPETEHTNSPYLLSAASLICLVLSALLLWNQSTLNKGAQALLSALQVTEAPTVQWFEEETDETQANTNTPSASVGNLTENAASGQTYVLNTNSKKIHSPTCRYAQSMNESNKETVSGVSIADLEARGYSVCSVCGAK